MSAAPVLVTGATGMVGGAVVRDLLAAGVAVRAMSRSAERGALLPPGVELIVGDLGNPADVARALDGVRSALYVAPHEANEDELAAVFTSAAAAAGIRVVFVGPYALGGTRLARAIARVAIGAAMPHYRRRMALAERMRRAVPDSVFLAPTNYDQMDDMMWPELANGRYPAPMRSCNRIDVDDVAAACVAALVDGSVAAGGYRVVGPASLSSAECAALWAAELGHDVRYVDDPTAWRAVCERELDGQKRHDVLATYATLRWLAVSTSAKQVAETAELIGRQPRSYAEYVKRSAARLR